MATAGRLREVYENGMALSMGATNVATLYVEGASGAKIAWAIFEVAAGFAGAPPTGPKDLVVEGTAQGIGVFETKVEETRNYELRQTFGEGYQVRSDGPQITQVT